MKKYKYISVAVAAMTLAACSSNNEPVNEGGSPVAARVSAGIGGTRAAGNQWDPDDCIGISGKSGNKTYANMKYQTSGDGAFSHVGGDESGILFETPEAVAFSAYYPFTGSDNNDAGVISDVKTDDQTKRKNFDFLFASGATASAANPALSFKDDAAFQHRMTRLILKIKTGEGFNAADVIKGTYTISGIKHGGTFDTATGEALAAGEATDNWAITAPAADADNVRTYDMILYPQSGTEITLRATFDGVSYTGTIATNLGSGYSNTYEITVNKTGLSVTGSSINQWVDTEHTQDATIIIPPFGNKPMEDAQPGDFYFSDGTFADKDDQLTLRQANACIGIVFHAGHHDLDGSDYSASGIGQPQCHGYVMALTDVSANKATILWGKSKNGQYAFVGTSTNDNDWNGYSNQKAIENYAANNEDGWEIEDFPAAYYISVYGTEQSIVEWHRKYTAPANSSGWFLPSAGQLLNIMSINIDNEYLLCNQIIKLYPLVDVDIDWLYKNRYYWSSTENQEDTRKTIVFRNPEKTETPTMNYALKKTSNYARAILAY